MAPPQGIQAESAGPAHDILVLKRTLTEGLPPAERRKLEKFLNRLGRKKVSSK